jgi:hypothetical protein
MEKPIIIRQGDVLWIEVNPDNLPHLNSEPSADAKAGIFQRGESTGHAHRLAIPEGAVILENWREKFVRVGDLDVDVIHEEHRTVKLPRNKTFAIKIAREFDYTRNLTRMVVD